MVFKGGVGAEEYKMSGIYVVDIRGKVLSEMLLEVEKRPWLWLHVSHIYNLRSFLNGWVAGRNNVEDKELLIGFDDFVVDQFGEGSSTSGWCNIIVKRRGEEDALSVFFRTILDVPQIGSQVKNIVNKLRVLSLGAHPYISRCGYPGGCLFLM